MDVTHLLNERNEAHDSRIHDGAVVWNVIHAVAPRIRGD